MPESLIGGDITIRESFPPQFVVPIDFDSLHGGYGNRTEQIVTQVITPHTIRVTVVNGMVTSAIIDGKWDELNQIQLPLTPTNGPSETVSHGGEAVDYVSLIDNLRANDTTVNPEGEIEQPFFFQIDIFDTVPNSDGYSEFRVPQLVTWNDDSTPRILTSVSDLIDAETNGLE